MIFSDLKAESIIQVNDKTRLDARQSFVSKDEAEIQTVEIEPESGVGFIDVTGQSSQDWFLDWEYSGSESRTVQATVRVTTDGSPVTSVRDISVLTASDDNLFSSDFDLVAVKSDIMNFLPDGRSSFLNVHRRAQTLIIDDLNQNGVTSSDGTRLEKSAVLDIKEVNSWSTFLTLWLIFEDLSNSDEDVFRTKANLYREQAKIHRNTAFLRLDLDGDGEVSQGTEGVQIFSIGVNRR